MPTRDESPTATDIPRPHPRYQRALTADRAALLAPGGALRFLLDPTLGAPELREQPFDAQLREKGELHLYRGATHPLVAVLRAEGRGHTVTFRAGKSYREGCGEAGQRALDTLREPFDGEALRARVVDYLRAALLHLDGHPRRRSFVSGEGRWQGALSLAFGRDYAPGAPLLFADREATLGFVDTAARAAYHAPFEAAMRAKVAALRAANHGLSFDAHGPIHARECDFLALDPEGDLLTVELKATEQRDDVGVYYSPLQATMYCEAFAAALDDIRDDLRALLRQKLALGLLPETARPLVERAPLRRVRAAVVLCGPSAPIAVRARFDRVQEHLGAARALVFTARETNAGLELEHHTSGCLTDVGPREWEPEESPEDERILDAVWDRIGRESGALPPVPTLTDEEAQEKWRAHQAGEIELPELWLGALKRRIGRG